MADNVLIFNITDNDGVISTIGQQMVNLAASGYKVEATFFVNNPVTDKIKFPPPPPPSPTTIGKCRIGASNVKIRKVPAGEEIGLTLAGKEFAFFERRSFGTGTYLRLGVDMWIASKAGSAVLATEI